MKLFNWFKKKPKPKPRADFDTGELVVAVRVDGHNKFIEQLEEMTSLVDVLSSKLERLGELMEPITITVVNNNCNCDVSDAEIEQS